MLLYDIMTDGLKIRFIKLRDKSCPSEYLPGATIKFDVFQSVLIYTYAHFNVFIMNTLQSCFVAMNSRTVYVFL